MSSAPLKAANVTRFAPSPTGYLHLGHAYAAWRAYEEAATSGRFLLRIEDIDQARCRPEYDAALIEDLAWLGLTWEEPVRRQSAHFDDYRWALGRLQIMGLIYPCFCTRKEIRREIAASPSAPHGPDGLRYPGTCRRLSADQRSEKIAANIAHAWRLDTTAALNRMSPLRWHDRTAGEVRCRADQAGDVVLARKDTPTSYHLAVTVDDALQAVTLNTRGGDLFHATHVHRLLQALLELPTPDYNHHPLLEDADGRRLAKRRQAKPIRDYRADGASPGDLRRLVGLPGC